MTKCRNEECVLYFRNDEPKNYFRNDEPSEIGNLHFVMKTVRNEDVSEWNHVTHPVTHTLWFNTTYFGITAQLHQLNKSHWPYFTAYDPRPLHCITRHAHSIQSGIFWRSNSAVAFLIESSKMISWLSPIDRFAFRIKLFWCLILVVWNKYSKSFSFSVRPGIWIELFWDQCSR